MRISKKQLAKNFYNKCFYCGRELPEDTSLWDIAHPEKLDNPDRVVPACPKCNNLLSNLPYADRLQGKTVGEINTSYLRSLFDERHIQQQLRIATSNHLLAADRLDLSTDKQRLKDRSTEAKICETQLEKELSDYLDTLVSSDEPLSHLFREAIAIHGAGLISVAKIVQHIKIEKAKTVSSLWKYAGYAPGFDRKKRRVRLEYNHNLRVALYNLAGCFMKSNSPYRKLYDKRKEHTIVTQPDWTSGHRHMDAIRFMMKIWLQHLWIRWRTLEGLPTNMPHIIAIQGHAKYMTPEEFGWCNEVLIKKRRNKVVK